MDQDENPYQAPLSPGVEKHEQHSSGELIDKGLQVFLAIGFLLLVTEFGLAVFMGIRPFLTRIVVIAALLFAGWRGHRWAITLLGLGLALGLVLGFADIVQAITSAPPIFIGLWLLLMVVHGGVLAALLFSPSFKAFLRSRYRQRRERGLIEPRTENLRNIVALTPDAAELVKATLRERKYPDDIVLRVVAEPGTPTTFEVKYDLLANDDRDWVGESSGVKILVAKEISDLLQGVTIDAKDGQYVFLEADGEV